jgi:C4-dicarboxylate-specific signal transduction histidine kinase
MIIRYDNSAGKNLLHVPPEEYGAHDNARLEADRMVNSLESYRQRANPPSTGAFRHELQSRRTIQALIEELREHERKEQQLRRYVEYLTLGQQLTRTASWAWNYSSGDLFWSRDHFRIFSQDPNRSAVSAEMFFRMIHPRERARVRQEFDAAVRAKRDFDAEFRIVRPDGSVAHVHSRGRPVFGKRGELTEYVGTTVDVTARRDGEDSLGSMQAELARASRVMTLGQLMASIAHEVNQPLAALIANANASLRWLQGKQPRIDKARQALTSIVADGNRASEIIAHIRGLVRKTDGQRRPLDLNRTVHEVLAFLKTELRRHSIMIRTNLAEDLPLVNADRVQMQQVLLNLVMNAIEAMSSVSSRRRLLTIVTAGEAPTTGLVDVVVSVKDRGIGIRAALLERIFEPFYSNKPQGMGIGLAISRSMVEAHGGSLRALPRKRSGATFQFRLPTAGVGAR